MAVAILAGPDRTPADPEEYGYLTDLWESDVFEGYSFGRCADLRSMSVGEFHDDFMSQGIGQEFVEEGFGTDIDQDYLYEFFRRKCDLEGL